MLSFGSSPWKVCKHGTRCIKFYKPIKATLKQRLHAKGPSSEAHWPKSTIILEFPMHCWATHLLKRQGEPSRDYCNFYVHETCQQWQYNSHSPSQKNNSFLPLMVAIKYKILTGTGPQMVSPKHPILPWDVDGGHLPPKRGGLTPHDQGKVHLKCNRSTQGALGAYTHNALQEG